MAELRAEADTLDRVLRGGGHTAEILGVRTRLRAAADRIEARSRAGKDGK